VDFNKIRVNLDVIAIKIRDYGFTVHRSHGSLANYWLQALIPEVVSE